MYVVYFFFFILMGVWVIIVDEMFRLTEEI